MAKATASPRARRHNRDRLRAKAKPRRHQTNETPPPKHELAWKHENKPGLHSPFSLNQIGTLSRRHLAQFVSAIDTRTSSSHSDVELVQGRLYSPKLLSSYRLIKHHHLGDPLQRQARKDVSGRHRMVSANFRVHSLAPSSDAPNFFAWNGSKRPSEPSPERTGVRGYRLPQALGQWAGQSKRLFGSLAGLNEYPLSTPLLKFGSEFAMMGG